MNSFYKKIENLYVHIDDDFSKEDIQAYKAGNLTVNRRDVIEFFIFGVAAVIAIALFDISAIVISLLK